MIMFSIEMQGVTIPSQVRYIQYWYQILSQNVGYVPKVVNLQGLVLHHPSPTGSKLQIGFVLYSKGEKVYTCNEYTAIVDEETISIPITTPIQLSGDVRMHILFRPMERFGKEKIIHFWFNTFFVSDFTSFPKSSIDKAHKDKNHKLFDENFAVSLRFSEPGSHRHCAESPTQDGSSVRPGSTTLLRASGNRYSGKPSSSDATNDMDTVRKTATSQSTGNLISSCKSKSALASGDNLSVAANGDPGISPNRSSGNLLGVGSSPIKGMSSEAIKTQAPKPRDGARSGMPAKFNRIEISQSSIPLKEEDDDDDDDDESGGGIHTSSLPRSKHGTMETGSFLTDAPDLVRQPKPMEPSM
jgi:hypothetical protein